MSKQSAQDLENRLDALEIKVNALMAANYLLQGILDQAGKMLDGGGGRPISTPAVPASYERPEPDPSWFPVIHQANPMLSPSDPGPEPCHQPAYYLIRQVTSQEKADHHLMRIWRQGNMQWRVPAPEEPSLCSTCFQPINPISSQQLDFSQARLEEPPQLPRATKLRDSRAARRSRSAPEESVRVAADYPSQRTPSGFPSPGPEVENLPEPTLPVVIGPMTPEATTEALARLTNLARSMGMDDVG